MIDSIERLVVAGLGGAALIWAGCGEPVQRGSADGPSSGGAGSEAAMETSRQPLEKADKAWFAAGVDGRGELVQRDGEPAEVTARFVNEGEGLDYGSMGKKGWLIASESGWIQLLDDEGKPKGAQREALEGRGTLHFVAHGGGSSGWLVGGAQGVIQRIDQDGQPTSKLSTAFQNGEATAGAAGPNEWLVGSSNGSLLRVGFQDLKSVGAAYSIPGGSAIETIVRTPGAWVALTETKIAKVTQAAVTNAVDAGGGRKLTTAVALQNTVILGADDGHIATLDASQSLSQPSWTKVFDGGQAVREIVRHADKDEWLAVGDGGAVRRLDADAKPVGSMQTIGGGKALAAVRPRSDGWMVGVRELSAVQRIDAQLATPHTNQSVLGDKTVGALAAGAGKIVVVGEGGAYRVLNSDGTPDGDVQTVGAINQFEDVAWNGSRFLMVGDGGQARLLAPDGTLGEKKTFLNGETIKAVSWSGDFWLVVSQKGTFHRLRRDATTYKMQGSVKLEGVEDAKFNGDQWMVVGTKDQKGAFAILSKDGTSFQAAQTVEKVDGTYRAVEWNGRHWLVGGDGGLVTRIDQSGGIINESGKPASRDVLYGMPVHTISFNAEDYLVGGANGAVRRLQSDTLPIRPAVAVNGFAEVRALQWTRARGFPGGPCVSKGVCLKGSCVGGVSPSGVCCEKACDGPCESCFEEVTGEPDGRCEPIPEGEEPPESKTNQGKDCVPGSKESCGRTGTCDGEGACAMYGEETTCAQASCSDGAATPAGHCNGMGDCVVPDKKMCEPFAGCAEGGEQCIQMCESNDDCQAGFVCKEGECVERGGDNGNGDEENGGADDKKKKKDGGCSTAGGSTPVGGLAWALFLVGVWARRRSANGARRKA